MRLITKVYVQDVLGLEKHEKGAEEFAQTCLRRWVASKCSKPSSKKTMRGGAPVLPIDYYGVQGAGYVDSDAGTSMDPTVEWSRPMISETFTKTLMSGGSGCSACAGPAATMAIAGGAKSKVPCFTIPMTAFKSVVGAKMAASITDKELVTMKCKFETLFEKVLKKAARMDKAAAKKVLSRASLEKVVSSEKQFSVFCSSN